MTLVYYECIVRRGLSILLIVFFSLGPMAATLEANDESRLPVCCRRHGSHKCAMSQDMAGRMAQMASGSGPAFGAPAHCPYFPGYLARSVAQVDALAASSVSLPFVLAQIHSPAASSAAARLSQIRTRAGRGPPASILA